VVFSLGFDAEGKLFDHRVGEHLAGDAFDLGFGSLSFQAILKGQNKVLTLPNVGDTFVFHPTQSVRNRLALGIQDSALQCNVDMSLHRV